MATEDKKTHHSSAKVISISTFSKKRLLIAGLVLLLLVVAAAPSYYFYSQYKSVQEKMTDPNRSAQLEIEDLIRKIEKHILLPGSEAPTLATVSDINKLKSQSFFKNAQNGDKVLIYSKAKRAYLYRPSVDVLVEVSTLEVAEKIVPTAKPEPPQAKKVISSYKVAILNGSSTVGLGGKVQDILEQKLDNVVVDPVLVASKKDYIKTIVVDLTGQATAEAQLIAKVIGGTVTNVPYTEKPPAGSDIVVVVGNDGVGKALATPKVATSSPTTQPEM